MRRNRRIKAGPSGHGQDCGTPYTPATATTGFCVFINTLVDGAVPVVRDGAGRAVVFQTEFEAQCEIADNAITRLQEFIDKERDFADALTIEEHVVKVRVLPDGSVIRATHSDGVDSTR